MRLHQLTDKQIHEWRMARLEYGRQKYGDRHLKRYNLVDLVEELLDGRNIVEFAEERVGEKKGFIAHVEHLKELIEECIAEAQMADSYLKDEHCTDEEGGERIWWSTK